MSLSDEIERAKKEEADRKRQYEEGKITAEQLYTEALDTFFSKQFKNISRQDEFYIKKIEALEIISILDEMRQIANLVYMYMYTTKKIVKQIQTPTLFGSKSTDITETVEVKIPIPAKIEISRSDTFGIFNGATIEVSQDNNSNWNISLTDFHDWTSYYLLKTDFIYSTHSTVDDDFQNDFDEWLNRMEDLERPLDYGFNVSLLWNFEYGSTDSDFPTSDTSERLTVSINKNVVTISCSNENDFASTPLSKCTPQWIRKKIAKAHVKHNFQ